MEADKIKSTLDPNANANLKCKISVDKLIKGYLNQFGIDVSKYFKGLSEVHIYECERTNYNFFYPFHISGDSAFYKKLQKFDWYYMPWKWENEVSLERFAGNEKILEVGSGGLGFLEKMNKKGFDITGLELNQESIIKARELGLNVFNESIEAHSKNNFEIYDVVCSFQVLEHISEVNSFIKAQIDCLKIGGKLIVAVPNNNSFIKLTNGGFLNNPPHHMGLWNKKSLISIASVFNLSLIEILYEPLQHYHLDWYVISIIQNKINKNRLTREVFKRLNLKNIFTYLVDKNRKLIKGHTVLAIYTKI